MPSGVDELMWMAPVTAAHAASEMRVVGFIVTSSPCEGFISASRFDCFQPMITKERRWIGNAGQWLWRI